MCLFNFDQMESLKETGKKFPLCGFLRAFSNQTQSGFIFLSDDTIVGKVTFCPTKPKTLGLAFDDEQLDDNYLHVIAGNALACSVQQLVEPFE